MKHGGGYYEAVKEPKYGETLSHQKECRATMEGIVNYPDQKYQHTLMSESSAGFGQTAKQNWSDFRISPNKRRNDTLAGDCHYHAHAKGAPYATTKVPRRPTTPLRHDGNPTNGRKLVDPSKPETDSILDLPIQPTVPLTKENVAKSIAGSEQLRRPSSAAASICSVRSIRSTVSERIRRVSSLTKNRGPNLQAVQKYVPIMSKSKGSYPSPRINKARRAAAAQALRGARKQRGSGGGIRSRKKGRKIGDSFVPVVAMVRPNNVSGFRGLHFKS